RDAAVRKHFGPNNKISIPHFQREPTMSDSIPKHMAAMLLMGHGDIDQLVYHDDVPVPDPGPDEVLVRITATAKNNTDRKAREGLYPTKDKSDKTSFAIGGKATLTFPRIQGADIVGRV